MSISGKSIAVLMGGWSSEREVSLVSGRAVAKALRDLGAHIHEVDVDRDIAEVLKALKPDVAFNALHGPWGEDGRIQAVLDILDIPYTHSGVLASAVAMDKHKTKAILREFGVPLADDKLVNRHEAAKAHIMTPPYVIKPVAEGSSFGVFIIEDETMPPPQEIAADGWTYGEDVLVEKFIPGKELSCAVLGDRPLAVTEIVPASGFYDFAAKYSDGGSAHVVPADVPEHIERDILHFSTVAHRALGCAGLSRSDFRYDLVNDKLVLLEVNTQPGMTPASLAPEQAAHCGMDFQALVAWMTEDALGRHISSRRTQTDPKEKAPSEG